jgi:sugar phosphate isomerase/epimerase
MSIKRSVSFYSYQIAYSDGKMNMEDMIKATTQTAGAPGVEIIAEQTPVGSFPNPSERDVAHWFELMDKYKATPVCLDGMVDWMLYKNRISTLKEQVTMMKRDIELAAKLGFKCMRALCPLRKEVFEANIPIAEDCGVKIGLEVHQPMMLHAKWTDEYYEMFERSGSKFVGIVPDFGIFQLRPARKRVVDAIKQGGRERILNFLVESCEKGAPIVKTIEEIKKMDAGPAELGVAMSFVRARYNDPEQLRGLKKYLVHFHGKFNEVDENYNETSIDYVNPIKVLKDIGYDGYISSEYEGQGMYGPDEDPAEVEQVRRHQAMLKKLIGE